MKLDRNRKIGLVLLVLAVFVTTVLIATHKSLSDITGYEKNPAVVLAEPEDGIYHAASPDIFSGWEEGKNEREKIEQFEEMVDKDIAWVSVSNTWFRPNEDLPCLDTQYPDDKGIHFPREDVEEALRAGVVPSIRMFPYDRCIKLDYEPYKLEHFVNGKYDKELRAWAQEAKEIPSPLVVTFGPEVNGFWFPWNLRHNGGLETEEYGDPELYDGHERFRDTYRRIIDIFREEGVQNITWLYHVNCTWPGDAGNPESDVDGYYPGDDYIDWIGVSCYGSQNPENDFWWDMGLTLGNVYQQIENSDVIGEDKPLALMEYGVTEEPRKSEWMQSFFEDVTSDRYPRLKALAWWQSEFCVDYDETEDRGCNTQTDIRVDSSSESLEVYKEYMTRELFIGEPGFVERNQE